MKPWSPSEFVDPSLALFLCYCDLTEHPFPLPTPRLLTVAQPLVVATEVPGSSCTATKCFDTPLTTQIRQLSPTPLGTLA